MKSRLTLLYGLFIVAAGVLLLSYLYINSRQPEPAGLEHETKYNNGYETSECNDSPVAGVEITEFEYWVSIQEDIWWRYAYRLRLRNNSDGEQTVRADIRYYDPDGTVIDSTTTNALTVPPGEEKSFTGHSLISVPGARRVEDAETVIRGNSHIK
jgi:hypothetical protein